MIAHVRQQVGIFGMSLGQDIPGSVQGGLRIGHPRVGIEVAFGQLCRIAGGIGQDCVGKGFKAGLACDLCPRAAFRFVRGVEVFESLFGIGLADLLGELRRELLLFGDGRQDRSPAILKLTQVEQTCVEIAQDRVIEAARGLLAIARDERDGRAVVDKVDDSGYLVGLDAEFEGQLRDDARQGFSGNLAAGAGDDSH